MEWWGWLSTCTSNLQGDGKITSSTVVFGASASVFPMLDYLAEKH